MDFFMTAIGVLLV